VTALSWCRSGRRGRDQNGGFDRHGGDGTRGRDLGESARHGKLGQPHCAWALPGRARQGRHGECLGLYGRTGKLGDAVGWSERTLRGWHRARCAKALALRHAMEENGREGWAKSVPGNTVDAGWVDC
jgi:hypothetical protein